MKLLQLYNQQMIPMNHQSVQLLVIESLLNNDEKKFVLPLGSYLDIFFLLIMLLMLDSLYSIVVIVMIFYAFDNKLVDLE